MANVPENLRYSKDDEWVLVDGNIVTMGITDYAQDQLSDIVYLELPAVGDSFGAGDIFGVVESVKAASDLYTPLGITITEVNEALIDTPETVNEAPFEGGWMVKAEMTDSNELDGLMDAAAYVVYCAKR